MLSNYGSKLSQSHERQEPTSLQTPRTQKNIGLQKDSILLGRDPLAYCPTHSCDFLPFSKASAPCRVGRLSGGFPCEAANVVGPGHERRGRTARGRSRRGLPRGRGASTELRRTDAPIDWKHQRRVATIDGDERETNSRALL